MRRLNSLIILYETKLKHQIASFGLHSSSRKKDFEEKSNKIPTEVINLVKNIKVYSMMYNNLIGIINVD